MIWWRMRMSRFHNLLFPPLDTTVAEDMRAVRPFFVMITGSLIFLYGWSVYSQPHLRQAASLVPFTLLIVIQGVLHWQASHFTTKTPRSVILLGVQISLAFILSLIGRNLALTYGLFMAILIVFIFKRMAR